MAEQIVTPPIRQSVEDANSAAANGIRQPLTEKSWYLYWSRLGQMANRQAGMITYGTHADRPDPGVMPDGALYIETDRGNVIYEKIDSAWRYVTGTMWDTLSPDHRPTDLGQADSNFDYRGTDLVREYIWTGYQWIDTTPVVYGTHAARLALTVADQIDTQLYIETDRGDVIYQVQGGAWQYVAGVMRGTLSPDQRPTDLGANDTGFDFRSTDQPLLQYAWNGSAWVEITGANYSVNGTAIATQTGLNLIAGSNTTISGVNNSGANRVDVTVTATGGGSGGAVSSVFGRTGAVVAQAGDYSAYEVTNAVDQTSSYTNPGWILSLAWSKITGAPSVSSYQTPWLSDINAASYGLGSVKAIGIGTGYQPSREIQIISAAANVNGFIQNSAANLQFTGGSTTCAGWTVSTTATTSCGGYAAVNSSGYYGGVYIGGVAATPAFAANALNLYTNAPNGIAFGISSTEYMRITSAGHVGIGTSSPSDLLHVEAPAANSVPQVRIAAPAATGANAASFLLATNAQNYYLQNRGTFDTPNNRLGIFGNASAELVTILPGGNLGVGINNPLAVAHLYRKQNGAATRLIIDNDGAGTGTGQAVQFSYGATGAMGGIYHQTDGTRWNLNLAAWSNSVQRTLVVIQGDTGNVGLSVTPSYLLHLAADSAAKPGTTTWTVPSDIRTKRNVQRFEGNMEVIRKLDPIVAEYNGLGGTPEGMRVVSFDAAKLAEIVPQCVSKVRRKLRESDTEETELLGVNIHEILFHMLRAVQQIDQRLSRFENS